MVGRLKNGGGDCRKPCANRSVGGSSGRLGASAFLPFKSGTLRIMRRDSKIVMVIEHIIAALESLTFQHALRRIILVLSSCVPELYVWGVFLTWLGVDSGWNTVRERWKINNRPRPASTAQFFPYNYSSIQLENGGEEIYFIKPPFLFLFENCINYRESRRGRGVTFHKMIIFIQFRISFTVSFRSLSSR